MSNCGLSQPKKKKQDYIVLYFKAEFKLLYIKYYVIQLDIKVLAVQLWIFHQLART